MATPHRLLSLFDVIFAGQVIVGVVPETVTVNEQVAVLPDASVTVCVTVVTPIGKVDPLAKPAVLTVLAPEQLSEPAGEVYVTTAPDPLVAAAAIFGGHLLPDIVNLLVRSLLIDQK